MGHAGTGTGIDFQTRGHTTPVTAVSQVFAVLQAHHYVRIFGKFFPIFYYFRSEERRVGKECA